MNLTESIRSAMINLLANKMRSLLTMVGIIIGISSVIMIISIGNGFKISVSDSFSQMGMDGLEVELKNNKEIITIKIG